MSTAKNIEATTKEDNRVQVVIESWHSYNSGYLLGRWIDITGMDQEEISEVFAQEEKRMTKWMHEKDGPEYGDCEELFLADFEAPFGLDQLLDEDSTPEQLAMVCELAELIESDGDQGALKIEVMLCEGLDLDVDSYNDLDDRMMIHLGSNWSDEKDQEELGYYLLEETGGLEGVPEHLRNYIDFQAYGRDCVLGGDFTIYRIDGESWAVSNH